MNPLNLATTSSPPPVANDVLAKRKRGRPRKDETTTHPQQESVNLVGKSVSGVVAGSFDAGYILNVKVQDSDTKLMGIVFRKGKVTPVTPENDVAPHVKMFAKEDIKNQTDLPPNDEPINDVEVSVSAPPLSLVPYQSDDEEPKEAVMVEEKDGVMEEGEAATPLLEFFPTPETTMVTPQQSLVLAQEETTEQQQKPPGESQTCGFGVKDPVGPVEKVPQELRLELGNKMIMSGDSNDNKSGTDPENSVSKSGFIANLFEGEGKKVDCAMEEEAAPSVQ
ncbi:DNA binding protein [Hirschfeldia incana]|nr:DNA binding protein [Hirschfeldia incana]